MALIKWKNRLNGEHKREHWKRKTETLRLFLQICHGVTTFVMAFGNHPLALRGPIWWTAMEGSCRNQKLFPDLIISRAPKPLIIRNKKNRLKAKGFFFFFNCFFPFLYNLPLVDWSLHKVHQGHDYCCWFSMKNGCLWLGEWQQDTLKETQSKPFDEMTAGIYSWRLLPDWCQFIFEPDICCKSLPWKSAF